MLKKLFMKLSEGKQYAIARFLGGSGPLPAGLLATLTCVLGIAMPNLLGMRGAHEPFVIFSVSIYAGLAIFLYTRLQAINQHREGLRKLVADADKPAWKHSEEYLVALFFEVFTQRLEDAAQSRISEGLDPVAWRTADIAGLAYSLTHNARDGQLMDAATYAFFLWSRSAAGLQALEESLEAQKLADYEK